MSQRQEAARFSADDKSLESGPRLAAKPGVDTPALAPNQPVPVDMLYEIFDRMGLSPTQGNQVLDSLRYAVSTETLGDQPPNGRQVTEALRRFSSAVKQAINTASAPI